MCGKAMLLDRTELRDTPALLRLVCEVLFEALSGRKPTSRALYGRAVWIPFTTARRC